MSPEENQERRNYIRVPKWTWPLFLAGAAALYGFGGCLERNFYSVPTSGRIVSGKDGKPERVIVRREFQKRSGGHDVLMVEQCGCLVPVSELEKKAGTK